MLTFYIAMSIALSTASVNGGAYKAYDTVQAACHAAAWASEDAIARVTVETDVKTCCDMEYTGWGSLQVACEIHPEKYGCVRPVYAVKSLRCVQEPAWQAVDP